MHVVCCDIDGTLVASADFDEKLYAEAIQDVLGVAVDADWSRYENITDSGILEEVLDVHSSPGQRARVARKVKSTYIERTARYLTENFHLIREVPGAVALAEPRATQGVVVRKRTYFRDGAWDQRAAAALGYDFVAVGNGVTHHLAFPDLQDLDEILSQLGV
mgnify:CR=1 FL=1